MGKAETLANVAKLKFTSLACIVREMIRINCLTIKAFLNLLQSLTQIYNRSTSINIRGFSDAIVTYNRASFRCYQANNVKQSR